MGKSITRKVSLLLNVDEKKLKRGLARAKAAFKRFGQAIKRMAKIGVVALAALGIAIALLGKNIIKTGMMFERFRMQLKVLYRSAAEGERQFEWIKNFAKTTPFALEQITSAAILLKATGLEAQTILRDLGDLAAATGKPLEQAVMAVSNIASGMTGIGMKQLMLMNITRDHLRQYGVEFNKQGALISSTESMIIALQKKIRSEFGGMMAVLTDTFEGQMVLVKDAWTQIKAVIAEPIMDILKPDLERLQGWLNNLLDAGRAKSFAKSIEVVFDKLYGYLKNWALVVRDAIRIIFPTTDDFKETAKGLGNAFGKELPERIRISMELIAGYVDAVILKFDIWTLKVGKLGLGFKHLFKAITFQFEDAGNLSKEIENYESVIEMLERRADKVLSTSREGALEVITGGKRPPSVVSGPPSGPTGPQGFAFPEAAPGTAKFGDILKQHVALQKMNYDLRYEMATEFQQKMMDVETEHAGRVNEINNMEFVNEEIKNEMIAQSFWNMMNKKRKIREDDAKDIVKYTKTQLKVMQKYNKFLSIMDRNYARDKIHIGRVMAASAIEMVTEEVSGYLKVKAIQWAAEAAGAAGRAFMGHPGAAMAAVKFAAAAAAAGAGSVAVGAYGAQWAENQGVGGFGGDELGGVGDGTATRPTSHTFGGTVRAQPMNVYISPSVSISGEMIFIGQGTVEELYSGIADVSVEATKQAIEDGDIDLTRAVG